MIGIALMGLGAGGVVAGAIAGGIAISNRNDAERACAGSYPDACASGSRSAVTGANDAARNAALVSTIGLVAGGALLASGAIVVLTSRSTKTSAGVQLAPIAAYGTGGVVVRGAW